MNLRMDDLMAFMRERHAIYTRRLAGQPPPWTADPILATYRFCNVYRELDRVTLWIAEHWRSPNHDDPDLWFAMVVARLVNWPNTLAQLGYPVPWNSKRFLQVLHKRAAAGQKVFGGAYIVSTNGHRQDKAEYLVEHVLNPLWRGRLKLRPGGYDTLESWHRALTTANGLGSFMAAQVVADVKYVHYLRPAGYRWSDWMTFAASGPGSRRGLNRVLGRDVNAPWREADWRAQLGLLAEQMAPMVQRAGLPLLHAQDLQNCLCEFDKYERVRTGQGKPRAKYVPHA